MENLQNYIKPELLILIPVLYLIGAGLKRSTLCPDKLIPVVLGLAGVLLACVWVLATCSFAGYQDMLLAAFTAVTQGVLCAGASVYVNQVVKQAGKTDGDGD